MQVSELADVFENTFKYKVIRKLLNSKTDKLPHQQLMKYIADFIYNEDEMRTLLLVYYAGHGSPKSADNGDHGLTLSGLVTTIYPMGMADFLTVNAHSPMTLKRRTRLSGSRSSGI